MNVPGRGLIRKAQHEAQSAQRQINRVEVPLTRRLGLIDFVRQLFKQMGRDHIGAFAGNLAYRGVFALFPFLVFLVSLLGIFHATSLVNDLIQSVSPALPHEAKTLLVSINDSITKSHDTGTFTIGAIAASLAALWGVSGGFRAVMQAMNVMYEVQERRPFWKVYLISIALSLAVVILVIGALVLVVFGPAIGGAIADRVGLGAAFEWTWVVLQWPILLAGVLLAFALVYYFAPNVEKRFRFVSPGAIVAVILWLLFSLLFSIYVNHVGSFNKTYGALAGLAIFVLYLYYSAFILLLGAEMNQIIESHPSVGKPAGEKTRGDEHPRDTRAAPVPREDRPARSRAGR